MKVPFTLGVVGHFGLAVRDPKKSARWFQRVLGLRKEFESENGIAVGNDKRHDRALQRQALPGNFRAHVVSSPEDADLAQSAGAFEKAQGRY